MQNFLLFKNESLYHLSYIRKLSNIDILIYIELRSLKLLNLVLSLYRILFVLNSIFVIIKKGEIVGKQLLFHSFDNML